MFFNIHFPFRFTLLTLIGFCLISGNSDSLAAGSKEKSTTHPKVAIKTNYGELVVELYPDKAPLSVKNFLRYVDEGFYEGTVFHRVIKGFMIQGGGFDQNMVQKKPHAPIKNEATNGLTNDRGTIAYARTSIVDSATSQFFINVVDNTFLNHRDNTPQGFGYCVFGKVVEGMDVADKIQNVSTGIKKGFRDVPNSPVIIRKIVRVK